MTPRLAAAINAVHQAGRLTLKYFQTGAQVDLKDDETPVTAADREAEQLIRKRLEESFRGETVLGEEQGLVGSSDDRWVIDPIDGTKSFISGVPLYSTLLSYEHAGEPILGVCYFPALDEMIYAETGSGTYWNGRPAHVSSKTILDKSVITCGSIITLEKQGRLASLLKGTSSAMALRTWCDAYGHALVATGRAEAMVDPVVSRWDVSAMAIIVREAGGAFTDFNGVPTLDREAISGTPGVHEKLIALF